MRVCVRAIRGGRRPAARMCTDGCKRDGDISCNSAPHGSTAVTLARKLPSERRRTDFSSATGFA